ncbi:prepilin-type N-terminal cleavage/methylation domain-containing protein [Sporofaciens musculi]|uniref:prepilin-type N-terminal cleavage/methylation domain-containing protein n=1 Tax=Sporofaciens musculi TaxID=2681861 RepID=UPI002570FA03|nr:prepilin-type N-terminal cleavage/methylation domain-containing protein [Sporofaciens musculi]
MMRSLKKNRKKGFTLVELIVVLVILAILAALLIPALTGYIDKAKTKQVIAETRSCVMAAQTLSDEEYAKGNVLKDSDVDAEFLGAVGDLAETEDPTKITFDTNGKVKTLEYTNGKTCTYDPDNESTNSDGNYNIS